MLGLALGVLDGLPLPLELGLQRLVLLLAELDAAVELVDFLLVLLQARLGRGLSGPLLSLLPCDLRELAFDLSAALLVAVLPLRELEMLQLPLVVALLERRARDPQLGEPIERELEHLKLTQGQD